MKNHPFLCSLGVGVGVIAIIYSIAFLVFLPARNGLSSVAMAFLVIAAFYALLGFFIRKRSAESDSDICFYGSFFACCKIATFSFFAMSAGLFLLTRFV